MDTQWPMIISHPNRASDSVVKFPYLNPNRDACIGGRGHGTRLGADEMFKPTIPNQKSR